MTLKPYKFIVQAVPQNVDKDGNVLGEVDTQPVVLFGVAALVEWANAFPAKLAEAESAQA